MSAAAEALESALAESGLDGMAETSDILEALKKARWRLVKLPEPTGINGPGNVVWNDGQTTHYVEQEFNGDVIINDRVHVSADELDHLSAVLLAASAEYESLQ